MDVFEKTIEQLRARYGLAGGILVAVKDGKVLFKQAFGDADVEQ